MSRTDPVAKDWVGNSVQDHRQGELGAMACRTAGQPHAHKARDTLSAVLYTTVAGANSPADIATGRVFSAGDSGHTNRSFQAHEGE